MASYGPSDIGAVLQGVGALAQAAAIGLAAWMASNTYQSWRRQNLSERRIEQAERILTAAYKARRALGYVRSPLMEAHELNAAEAQLEEKDFRATVEEERKERLVLAQGYYNRLNAVMDERRAVEKCLPMARALFGEQVEKALELLNRQFHMVKIAVDANSETGNDSDFSRSLWEDISSSSGTDCPNKMNLLIEEQVKLIEDALLPVLRLEATQG
jgi:hypothetical protein